MRNDPNKVLRISASATVNARDYTMVLADATDGAIALTLITPGAYSEWSIKVKNVGTGDGVTLSVAGGGSFSFTLPAGAGCEVTQDDLGVLHVFGSTSGSSGGGPIPAGSSITYSSEEYGGTGSFQPIAPDLNLAVAAGSDDGADPSYLGTVMGNVLGADLTEDANYIGGVIGAYSITGTKATTYPTGAVLAQITDGVTEVQGAVTAYIDGDGTQTNANAAFAIMQNNSVPGSGFDWVVDGHGEAHDGYNAAVPLKGFARLNVDAGGLPVGIYFGTATDDAGIVAQVGADNTIADGSLYISATVGGGAFFQKVNDVWTAL